MKVSFLGRIFDPKRERGEPHIAKIHSSYFSIFANDL
jgi:hypothetical protein